MNDHLHTIHLRPLLVLIPAIAFAACFYPASSHAGLTINAPRLGLNGSLRDGLVGYWSFDGPDMAGNIAYDRSPDAQASNANLINGPRRVAGRIGQALELDLGDDKIDPEPDSAIENLDVKTVAAWIKVDNFNSTFPRIAGSTQSTTKRWAFEVEGQGNNRLVYDHTFATTVGSWASPVNSITAGAWHHVVVIYDRTSLSNDPIFYIDGIRRTTTETTAPVGSILTEEDVVIGALTYNESDPNLLFEGAMDDFRIYNRALSADEIKRLYKIGATFVVNKPVATGSLNEGLVGYWPFEDTDLAQNSSGRLTSIDRSGQGNHGSSTIGTTAPRKTIGKIGQALDFDGLNDYVNAGSPSSLNNIAVKTLSAWIKLNRYNSTGFDTFLTKLDNGSVNDPNWNLNIASGAQGTNWLRFDYGFWDGSNGIWRTPANSVQLNRWYHVAVIYANTSAANDPVMYIDGVSQAVTEIQGPTGTNESDATHDFAIGTFGTTNPIDLFNGIIDEVRIYNRALSADEIKRLYRMGGGR